MRARRLLNNSGTVDELSCPECEDALELYLEAELVGEDAAALFPRVAEHLHGCARCKWLYGLLKSALEDRKISEHLLEYFVRDNAISTTPPL